MIRVLLVSTYELGRQPWHVASPAASLRARGHAVQALDLAVEAWDDRRFDEADAVAISVPMHTAARLAVEVVARLRAERPGLPVALYGLYAPQVAGDLVDARMGGEYEPALTAWLERRSGEGPGGEAFGSASVGAPVSGGGRTGEASVSIGRSTFVLPARDLLPPLSRYAHLRLGGATDPGDHRLVGAVEATHGCTERCRHCPLPAVYDGRTRALPVALVMADIEQLVGLGAGHITFADADFLAGPAHARRLIEQFRDRFTPRGITFDVTTKVAHILRHDAIVAEMAAAGCLFVVTAVESVNDDVLVLLDKGHTAADAARAMVAVRSHGIDPHPTFLPFTPWTRPGDVADLCEFLEVHDLLDVVDPVQMSLRLLLPQGSLLLERSEIEEHLVGYDPDGLTWRWRAGDPEADDLQRHLGDLVGEAMASGEPSAVTWARIFDACGRSATGVEFGDGARADSGPRRRPKPRLSEPWFC